MRITGSMVVPPVTIVSWHCGPPECDEHDVHHAHNMCGDSMNKHNSAAATLGHVNSEDGRHRAAALRGTAPAPTANRVDAFHCAPPSIHGQVRDNGGLGTVVAETHQDHTDELGLVLANCHMEIIGEHVNEKARSLPSLPRPMPQGDSGASGSELGFLHPDMAAGNGGANATLLTRRRSESALDKIRVVDETRRVRFSSYGNRVFPTYSLKQYDRRCSDSVIVLTRKARKDIRKELAEIREELFCGLNPYGDAPERMAAQDISTVVPRQAHKSAAPGAVTHRMPTALASNSCNSKRAQGACDRQLEEMLQTEAKTDGELTTPPVRRRSSGTEKLRLLMDKYLGFDALYTAYRESVRRGPSADAKPVKRRASVH